MNLNMLGDSAKTQESVGVVDESVRCNRGILTQKFSFLQIPDYLRYKIRIF